MAPAVPSAVPPAVSCCAVAFLVCLAAAARARVVAAYGGAGPHHRRAPHGTFGLIAAVGDKLGLALLRRRLGLCLARRRKNIKRSMRSLRAIEAHAVFLGGHRFQAENERGDVARDAAAQFLEHLYTFPLVFVKRVLLAVGAVLHPALEVVHLVQVVLPQVFPKILLTGAAGVSSVKLEDLFTGPAKAWNFAPQITVPIFDAGNNKANLDVAKLTKLTEVANYEKAVQSAFREVADALTARAMLEEQIAARQALVKAEQQRFHLAELRYRNGIDSYLNVLSAQQDLYNAQQTLIATQTSRLANLVTLYKALGGGWLEHSAESRPTASLRFSPR